ncbi:MAG TPA: glycosyltransferase family 2 protein [Acidimicrobiales bacterium]|nr:glycosyltransferase family 2 protein [Acidimicrobiales bacterium]
MGGERGFGAVDNGRIADAQSNGSSRPVTRADVTASAPPDARPTISVVVPCFDEALVIMRSLDALYAYLDGLSCRYRFELIVVDDGSTDETAEIADAFARSRAEVRVLRQHANTGVGQALRRGIAESTGEYVVTLDCDLSYSPDHIGRLVDALREDHARISIASPYMRGGRYSGVPWRRKVMSRCANRLLAASSKLDISTVTSLVRAYDGEFIRSLDLSSDGPEVNTEIIYKAQILDARVVEVPAHLDWTGQAERTEHRRVALRVRRTSKVLMFSSFLFRPIAFFVVPGVLLLLIAISTLCALGVTVAREYSDAAGNPDNRLFDAFATAWQLRPQTFIIGGISFVIAVQLISLGVLAGQSKRYFEELFHIETRLLRHVTRLDARIDATPEPAPPALPEPAPGALPEPVDR